jgi:hypothetical protein
MEGCRAAGFYDLQPMADNGVWAGELTMTTRYADMIAMPAPQAGEPA